jgi:hypothetical protein
MKREKIWWRWEMEQRKCGDLRLRRGGREYGRWRKENKEITNEGEKRGNE